MHLGETFSYKSELRIELALDVSVAILNHMRRLKRSTERAAAAASSHGLYGPFKFSASKRIPSWNYIARENSTGSLDEDVGRNWRGPRGTHDGSDNETENAQVHSWTGSGENGSSLMVSEGDLLHSQRIHNGIVFNVVKRENFTPSSRSHDSESFSTEEAECMQLDCPEKDVDVSSSSEDSDDETNKGDALIETGTDSGSRVS